MTSLHDQFAHMSPAERDEVVSQAMAVQEQAAKLQKQFEDDDKPETQSVR